MATRFGKFQKLAQRLITKNARLVTFKVVSETPLLPAEPWGPNTPDVDITNIPAVFLDYKNQEIDGTLVMLGDKKCLIAQLDMPTTQPETKDKILEADGSEWKIVRVKTLQPGNIAETIMWTLQLRS